MKRIQAFTCAILLLLCAMLALSACGGSDVTSTTTTSTNSSSSANATPTRGGASNTSSSSSSEKEVHVTLGEMYFKPDTTTFKVGQAYKFILKNEGKTEHEFTIAPPRKAGGTEKTEDAESLIDSDNIKPGETREVDLTFHKAAPAGTLEIECSYPGHYEMGMHIGIVVEP